MNFISDITNYITRPTRQRYHINRLGPKRIVLQFPHRFESLVFRDDYEVINFKGKKIVFSFYMNQLAQQQDTCVVYLHANNGSRVEGLHYLQPLLQNKLNVCLLDFSGSGSSQGDYISLGPNQTEDLACIFQQLYNKKGITKMVLWGRSMGASTALMYAHKYHNNVAAMILDSPFENLRTLVKQSASDKTGIPQFIFQPILNFVDDELHHRIGYRFSEYEMKKYILDSYNYLDMDRRQIIPALFIASKSDKLVKAHHVEDLFNIYPGYNNQDKFLHYITNQHHQDRDHSVISKCINFIIFSLKNRPTSLRRRDVAYVPSIPQLNIPLKRGQSRQKSVQSGKFSFKSQNVVQLQQSTRQKRPQPHRFIFSRPRIQEDKKYIKGVNLTNSINLGQADQQNSIYKSKNINLNSKRNQSHKINLSDNSIDQSFQSYSISNHPNYSMNNLNSSHDQRQQSKMIQIFPTKSPALSLPPQNRPIFPQSVRSNPHINLYRNNQNWNTNMPRNYRPELMIGNNITSPQVKGWSNRIMDHLVKQQLKYNPEPHSQQGTARKTLRETYRPNLNSQSALCKPNTSSRSLTNKISLSKMNLSTQKLSF